MKNISEAHNFVLLNLPLIFIGGTWSVLMMILCRST